MTLIHKPKFSKPVLDLRGPDGNANVILGTARQFARQLRYSKDKSNDILKEMMSGNYKHLVEVFDREFGDYIDVILLENWSVYE